MLSTVFEHDKVVFSMKKNFITRDAVECSNVFLSAEYNPKVAKTVLSTPNHCLLRLDNSLTLPCSVLVLNTGKNQSDCENHVMNCLTRNYIACLENVGLAASKKFNGSVAVKARSSNAICMIGFFCTIMLKSKR